MVLLEKLGKLFKRCASAEPEFWLPGSESGEGATVRSRADWEAVLSRFAARMPREEEPFLRALAENPDHVTGVPGVCDFCGKEVPFHLDTVYGSLKAPNFRERMICPLCEQNSRTRKMLSKVKQLRDGGKRRIYMMEALTDAFRMVQSFCPEVTGSEYISPELESGARQDGILHEDAQNLSFPDASFDLIVSCDVFEHVDDARRCFREAARVLAPGGVLYLTVPFFTDRDRSVRRAGFENGELKHYLPPAHPDTEGALVFWDYGWDLLDWMKEAGFSDAYLQPYYSRKHGHMGAPQYYFIGVG